MNSSKFRQLSTLFLVSISALVFDPKPWADAAVSRAGKCERAFVSSYDSSPEAAAAALVAGLKRNNRKIENSGPNSFRPNADSDLMIFFKGEALPSILTNGFLNIHQTGTTNGDSTQTSRAQHEDFLVGRQIEPGGYGADVRQALISEVESGKLSGARISARKRELNRESAFNQLRPKSAYLVIRNRQIQIGNVVFRNQYGHYGAVLKESVLPRSTWTPTDSLAASPDSIFVFDDRPVSVRAHGDKDIKYYFEGQIWGPLDIRHVKYWIVPRGTSVQSEIYRLLATTGLPIREYDLVTDIQGPFETRRPVVIDDAKTP